VKGNIAVNCPFCADDDKYHLGIALDKDAWGCWRSGTHRGRSPLLLVKALLRATTQDAKSIVAEATGVTLESFSSLRMLLNDTMEADAESEDIVTTMPVEFEVIKPFNRHKPCTDYLRKRGFSDAVEAADYYNLRYATKGYWRGRIVFPIVSVEQEVVTWTARHLGNSEYRYLSLSQDENKSGSQASKNIKDVLWNEDLLAQGGDVLVVTEGPFDAMKVDWYAKDLGVICTCMFGKTPTENQLHLLKKISVGFDKIVFVLDEGTGMESLGLSFSLPNAVFLPVPYNCDDLGDLTAGQVVSWVQRKVLKD